MTLLDITTAGIGVCSAIDIVARRLGAMSLCTHRASVQIGYALLAAVCLWSAYLSASSAAGAISDLVVLCVAMYLAVTWSDWVAGPPPDAHRLSEPHGAMQPATIRPDDRRR